MGDIRDCSGFASIFLFESCLTLVVRREPEDEEIHHLGKYFRKVTRNLKPKRAWRPFFCGALLVALFDNS